MASPDLSRADWRKSSYTEGMNNCVEVALGREVSAVRDSKDPDGPVLEFAPAAFAAFVRAVKVAR